MPWRLPEPAADPAGAASGSVPAPTVLLFLTALVLAIAASPGRAGPDYPCLIEPSMVVDLSTAVEGVIDQVLVSKGDEVSKDMVVARLESSIEELSLEQAKIRVETRSLVRAREVTLEAASKRYDRAVRLSDQKFVSPDELSELKSNRDLAREELATERSNALLSEVELRRAQAALDQRMIRSPLNGVVVERYLNPGEFAQAQPIVRVAQLDPLYVEAVLPGSVYGQVRVGMPVQVRLLDSSSETFDVNVTIVEKVIDAASGTFGIRVELPNSELSVPAGLECLVRFAD